MPSARSRARAGEPSHRDTVVSPSHVTRSSLASSSMLPIGSAANTHCPGRSYITYSPNRSADANRDIAAAGSVTYSTRERSSVVDNDPPKVKLT
ncbi:Uncharacterised protein [Mycobacteroides abscessus subsp. abscessus]|nr:Uncharacterised protein [Mycobacteroides abscessus subsp. abscessus]